MSLILVIFPEPGKVTSASYPDPPSHFLRPRWQTLSSRTSCHRHILCLHCSVFLCYHQILHISYIIIYILPPTSYAYGGKLLQAWLSWLTCQHQPWKMSNGLPNKLAQKNNYRKMQTFALNPTTLLLQLCDDVAKTKTS